MQVKLHPKIALPIAAFALIASLGIWYYLLRPVPQQQQLGVIQKIEFFAKEVVERNEARNLRNGGVKKSGYKLPNRFIYTIKLEDGKIARYQENAHSAKSTPEYAIDDKLTITYQLRKLPFGNEKIMVFSIEND